MLAVNYTNLRENMKTYMDKVTDDYETMIVTRKDNKNVVMLSEHRRVAGKEGPAPSGHRPQARRDGLDHRLLCSVSA